MKSYKEYYKLGLDSHLDWKSKQEEEWWRRNELKGKLNLEGDYIETINVLSEYEKNDSSLFTNHTNVKNSEWDILFDMLGQALIDWCNENNQVKKPYSFVLSIKKVVDGTEPVYETSFVARRHTDKDDFEKITSGEFEGCRDFLCDLVETFISQNGKNIPCDWNYFSFSLDDLETSCKYGEWTCFSDGYMTFGNLSDPDKRMYDEYVLCM